MSTSLTSILLVIFYLVILLFATSDLKRFIFHVHISRVDRVPIDIDVDPSSSLWYPILSGIIFNIFIIIFSMGNLYVLLSRRNLLNQLCFSTVILLLLFTIRFILNIIITKTRNGFSTPTLVEQSLFASSLSLEEEIATIFLNWCIKIIGFICTFLFYFRKKRQQTNDFEKTYEIKLMSSIE